MTQVPRLEDFYDPAEQMSITLSCGTRCVELRALTKAEIEVGLQPAWNNLWSVMHQDAWDKYLAALRAFCQARGAS